jgi:hypothetical protein
MDKNIEKAAQSISEKSRKTYIKAWKKFVIHIGRQDGTQPTEEDLLDYFRFLKREKKLAGSTLWTTFSRINGLHIRLFGTRLQQWPRIKQDLQAYQQGEGVKQSLIFTHEEILQFLGDDQLMTNPYWLVRQAYVVIANFGGHR